MAHIKDGRTTPKTKQEVLDLLNRWGATMTTGNPTILLNGKPVPSTPFAHERGQPHDLFLRVADDHVVWGGDRLEWTGTLPESKTYLWVRFTTRTWNGNSADPARGNVLLTERDYRHTG